MTSPKGADSRSPQEKRGSAQEHFGKGSVRIETNRRDPTPSPWRHHGQGKNGN